MLPCAMANLELVRAFAFSNLVGGRQKCTVWKTKKRNEWLLFPGKQFLLCRIILILYKNHHSSTNRRRRNENSKIGTSNNIKTSTNIGVAFSKMEIARRFLLDRYE